MDAISFYGGVVLGAVIVGIALGIQVKRLKDELENRRAISAIERGCGDRAVVALFEAENELDATREELKRYQRNRDKSGRFTK